MSKGLVLEGGAMRGLFTAGVMDVLMENGIKFDATIGVSAGACFGCNYKSRQIGRVVRYATKYCNYWKFCSFRSWLVTGDVFGGQFCYYDIPKELDKFDYETYRSNSMDFIVIVVDINTGEAVYHKMETCDDEDIKWMRASASVRSIRAHRQTSTQRTPLPIWRSWRRASEKKPDSPSSSGCSGAGVTASVGSGWTCLSGLRPSYQRYANMPATTPSMNNMTPAMIARLRYCLRRRRMRAFTDAICLVVLSFIYLFLPG